MNVTEPIRHLARTRPDLTAIIRAGGSAISFAALDAAIDGIARSLRRGGIGPGAIVPLGITGPDESVGLTAALALARVGAASATPKLDAAHLTRPQETAGDATPSSPPVAIHPGGDALLRVFASSGTTGKPKFIPISHALMTRRIFESWLSLGGERDIRLVALPLDSSSGFRQVLRTLWQGGTLVLSNPADTADSIRRHQVRSLVTAPVSLGLIVDHHRPGAPGLPSLRMIQVTGSRLPPELARIAAEALCPNIVTLLGSSESGSIASASVTAMAGRPGAAGFIHPGVTVEATDAQGRTLPAGEEGVLRIRSDTVIDRYFDGTAALQDGWFSPGDLGTVWPDGMLSLAGRVSELINTGGVKLDPSVIERALLSLPGVLDAAAFGVPDAHGLIQPWAAIVPRARIDDVVIEALCTRALGPRAPAVVLQLKTLPRNGQGKIMRSSLTEMAGVLQQGQAER